MEIVVEDRSRTGETEKKENEREGKRERGGGREVERE